MNANDTRRESTLAAIERIARDIAGVVLTEEWRADNALVMPNGELATREAGIALFFIDKAIRQSDTAAALVARQLLTITAERMNRMEMRPGLYSGVTGVAFVLDVARRAGILDEEAGDDPDPVSEFDEVLYDIVCSNGDLEFDLFEGLAGFGTYALARLPRPGAKATVEAICRRLAIHAEAVPGGVSWSNPLLLDEAPGDAIGQYAVGLAHGAAGIVAFLSAAAVMTGDSRARELVERAVPPLVSITTPRVNGPCAPRVMDASGLTWGETSYSWCWGDIGVALALARAGHDWQCDAWRHHAARIAMAAAENMTPHMFFDASLCHGWAGTCQALESLAHLTEEPRLLRHATYWHDALLAGRGTNGYGGYQFLVGARANTVGLTNSAGLLTGSAGVGLALLSRLGGRGCGWEQAFLMDVPQS